MSDMPFHPPVAIAVGAGFRRNVGSVAEMQNFLKEWPEPLRGKAYAAAMKACDMARNGHLTADQVRCAFVGFVEATGIAWSGVDPVTALRRAKVLRRATRSRGAGNGSGTATP